MCESSNMIWPASSCGLNRDGRFHILLLNWTNQLHNTIFLQMTHNTHTHNTHTSSYPEGYISRSRSRKGSSSRSPLIQQQHFSPTSSVLRWVNSGCHTNISTLHLCCWNLKRQISFHAFFFLLSSICKVSCSCLAAAVYFSLFFMSWNKQILQCMMVCTYKEVYSMTFIDTFFHIQNLQ